VDEKLLDANGFLRYVRHEGETSKYHVMGECFIVPRSYMGYRDEKDNFKDCWGTGEYKLTVNIKESCDVTDQYRANWKADYKRRKEMAKKNHEMGIVEQSWQVISNQKWDEITQSWVITTLKAPASYMSKDLIDKLGLE
jgi:hypothetical protein